MPVVINEVEILESQPAASAPASASAASPEPVYEQLRRYTRDLEARQRRLMAD